MFRLKAIAPRLQNAARLPVRQRKLFSSSPALKGGDHHDVKPIVVGPGGADGAVPTDYDQATGARRLEALAEMQGFDWFDMEPLKMTHHGTKKNPIYVRSVNHSRLIGCSGFPVDSHEIIWMDLRERPADAPPHRCPDCGSVFKLFANVPAGTHQDPEYNPPYVKE